MKTIRNLLLPLAVAAAVAACGQTPAPTPDAAAPTAAQPAAAPVAAETPAAEVIKPAAGVYVLDPDHTDVLAQWSHFGLSKPSAHFRIRDGKLTWDAADISKSSVDVRLDMSSIDTFVPALDTHLKKPDFFDVGTFPDATFKSTAVQAAGTNALTVTGDLTIKDKTHPVTLAVTLNGAGKHAMTGQQAIGFSATGQIKRSDYGVDAFAPNVSDTVDLRITTEGAIADAEPKQE